MDPAFAGLLDFVKDASSDNGHTIFPNANQCPDTLNEYNFNVPSSNLKFPESSWLSPDLGYTDSAPTVAVAPAAESYAPSTSDNFCAPSVGSSSEGVSSSDDSEYSETVLKFIGQILMDEDTQSKPSMFYDPLGLRLTEKLFYDALGETYPPSPNLHQEEPPYINHNLGSSDVFYGTSGDDHSISSNSSTGNTTDRHWAVDVGEYNSSFSQAAIPIDNVSQANSELSSGSQFLAHQLNSVGNVSESKEVLAQNIFTDAESVLQFRRGLEEASKFLPKGNQLVIDLETSIVSPELRGEDQKVAFMGEEVVRENSLDVLRGRRNHKREDGEAEEGRRSNKQCSVYVEEYELSEKFDKVLLSTEALPLLGDNDKNEPLQNEASRVLQPTGQLQGANGGKSRAKKQGKKRETFDLSTSLTLCAQAVSAGDYRTANELLKQIRQHSSPYGDGSQRLAHYFANGLEARMVGTGTGPETFYCTLISHKIPASEILKAYAVNLSVCPFKRVALFIAGRMIYNVAEKATSLHLIDFGIQYGFHWPILIQKLSERPGGPPKLRITGIEFPQPGFRPAERIEETGRHLVKYCKRFNVPFEYHALASQNWESIQIEELKIDRNEMLAVNCLNRFENVQDDTDEGTSPRDGVLKLIRRLNPDIFAHSIFNGSHSVPFFVTRFREALFHFSSLYDILEATLPRESPERLMYEREFIGRSAMNVIACEGTSRVERPETYKQWHVRNMRAGFRLQSVERELLTKLKSKVKEWYHKDFIVEEDKGWVLQGWKGRILFASSCWVPTKDPCTGCL